MSRGNGTSEEIQCRRNGSRRNGTIIGEMGVGEAGTYHFYMRVGQDQVSI